MGAVFQKVLGWVFHQYLIAGLYYDDPFQGISAKAGMRVIRALCFDRYSLLKRGKGTMIYSKSLLLLALLAVFFLGCKTVGKTTGGLITLQEMPMADNSSLTLKPGDELEVKFRFWPELDDKQIIRPDGKITLQEIDDVQAAGLTPAALDAELTKLYAANLKDPVISVVVRSLSDRHVYVNGEVRTPGVVPMSSPMTALEAILTAGGFNIKTAKPSNVVIIRHKEGKRYACLLDLSGALENNLHNTDFYLAPQDIVYVPRTRIEKVNQWVDSYINRLLPAGLTYSQTFVPGSPTTTGIGYTPPGARTQ